MKNKMRKSFLALFFLIILSILPVQAAIPEPTSDYYASDHANVLTKSTIDYIVQKNVELENATGAQIVVATVDFIDGRDFEDYAYELFESWKIGSSADNNGFLLILAIGEDDYYTMQGTGTEDFLSSGDIGYILQTYLEPDFAEKNYDEGAKKTFDQFYQVFSDHYASELSSDGGTDTNTYEEDPYADYGSGRSSIGERIATIIGTLFGILLLIGIVIVIISLFSGRGGGPTIINTGGYYRPRRSFFFFGSPWFGPRHHHRGPPPPPGPGPGSRPGGPSPGGPPPGGRKPNGQGRPSGSSSGLGGLGGLFGGGGGSTRGGGVGRGSSGGGSFRGGSGLGGGRSGGSFRGGGGGSRGGGVGRRK